MLSAPPWIGGSIGYGDTNRTCNRAGAESGEAGQATGFLTEALAALAEFEDPRAVALRARITDIVAGW